MMIDKEQEVIKKQYIESGEYGKEKPLDFDFLISSTFQG